MTSAPSHWEKWRTAYRRLPFVVRGLLVVFATLLGPLGIFAMFTPLAVLEIGSLLVFVSLTILSFEFDWAYRLLLTLRRKLENVHIRRGLMLFTGMVLLTYLIIIVRQVLQK